MVHLRPAIQIPANRLVVETIRLVYTCMHAPDMHGAPARLNPCCTGDNIHTACHIARECGILHDSGSRHHIALEGPVFRRMSEEEMKECLPQLRVSE
jgi:hypothetical protein